MTGSLAIAFDSCTGPEIPLNGTIFQAEPPLHCGTPAQVTATYLSTAVVFVGSKLKPKRLMVNQTLLLSFCTAPTAIIHGPMRDLFAFFLSGLATCPPLFAASSLHPAFSAFAPSPAGICQPTVGFPQRLSRFDGWMKRVGRMVETDRRVR